MKKEWGLLHIYYGDGKGKTTAALGLGIRAAGRGIDVIVAQFLKSGDTGELHFLIDKNIKIIRSEKKFPFTFQMTEKQKEEIALTHDSIFHSAQSLAMKSKKSLLILDEIIDAYNGGYINCEMVDRLIQAPHDNVEIVMTGRNPCESFVVTAEYVSEVRKIKHPFDTGLASRKGIEL